MRRHVLDSNSSNFEEDIQVRVVQTVEQLQDAVDEGVEHIEVQNHMRLIGLSLRDSGNEAQAVLVIPPTVRTLTGNCTANVAADFVEEVPDLSQLVPLNPAQCLLLFTEPPLSVPPSGNSDGKLWLDNLYFRYIPPGATEEQQTLPQVAVAQLRVDDGSQQDADTARPLDSLWMTNVTIQGDGERPLSGAQIQGRVYAEDCTFSHLGPDVPTIQVQQDAASAAFHACTFQNFISNDSAVGILEASGSSGLMVNASEFLQNDVDALFVADDVIGTPLFYSDSSSEVVSSTSGNASLPLPLSELQSSQIQFLDGEVGGSSEVVEQVEQAPRSVRLITKEELGTMSLVAIVLSCAILGCCATVGLLAWVRRHMNDKGWSKYGFPKHDRSGPVDQNQSQELSPSHRSGGRRSISRANPVTESRGRAHTAMVCDHEALSSVIANPVFSRETSPDRSVDGESEVRAAGCSAPAVISTARSPPSPSKLRQEYRDQLQPIGSLSIDLDTSI